MRRFSLVLTIAVGAAMGLVALSEAKDFTIDTSPFKGGRVSVDGRFVGVAPVKLKLKLKKGHTAVATAEMDGALSLWSTRFDKDDTKGTIFVRLEVDEAYRETVVSDVANTWLTLVPRLTHDPTGAIDEGRVWQKIVSIVTDEFSDLEEMDRDSFYLRTAWRMRKYPYTVLRHRLVIKRGVTEELSVKVSLESQVYRGTGTPATDDFVDEARIFQSDKEIIDFMRDQL